MKLLLPIEIHVAVCELQATHRPTIAGYSYRTASFKYRCYVGLCGTAALHRQASTAVQQLVFKNIIQNNVHNSLVAISESVVVLNEVIAM